MRTLNRLVSEECSPEAIFVPPAWYFEQDLWVQDAMAPGNVTHNYPLPMRIRGPLNHEALEQSLQEILRRHSVLFSIFRIVDGKTAQMIMQPQPLAIPALDLTGLPKDEREAKVEKAVLEDVRRPFDLTRGPMLRTALLRLAAEEYILLLTTHHILCDYWSSRILVRELFTLYAAFSAKQPSHLPELGYQYGDFVRQLETRLQGKELESRLAFWKERLAGKHFHHLAPDHLPPVTRTYRGTHEMAIYPQELSNSIKLLGARERLSPFMIMLAAVQCLLQRYSGDEEIGVGSCVANRPLLEIEGLIGPFANVAVLRSDLSGNPTFREVFRRVREESLAAYSYQDTPFGMLVDNFQPAFDPARHPLIQMVFVFLNAPSESWEVPGLTVDPIPVDMGTSCYELNMNVRIQERFEVDLQYSSDLFEAATVHQILQDYRAVLQMMCNNPDARICELPIHGQQLAIKGPQQPDLTRTRYLAPNGAVESRLTQLWEAVLEKRPIGVNDDFFELGGDSLRAARLFARIEQRFQRSLPVGTLFQAPTIAALAKIISDGSSSDTCVVPIQSGNARPPLYCLPAHTGSVLLYRTLAQHLGSDQPVYGLQPQGLDGKHVPLTRIEDMAVNFVRDIRLIQPKGPYFVAGYCMGGTIALEMAQQLRRQGETVGMLALLDTYNWRQAKRTSFVDNLCFRVQQWWFSWHRGGSRWKKLRDRGVWSLPIVALPVRKESSRRFNTLCGQPAVDRVSECNVHAALSYKPQAYPGRILHVRATRQCGRYKRPELSLNSFALNGVEEFFLRGYSTQILQEPLVRQLAAKLRACIDDGAAQCKLLQTHGRA
jgi:thioesterase domain-containing protein/acyl carrier protein